VDVVLLGHRADHEKRFAGLFHRTFALITLPNVFGIEASKLAKQLLRPLVEQSREHDSHLYDEITSLTRPGRNRAAATYPEPLTRLRPRRHAQPRPAVWSRYFDFRAKRRLVHGQRHHRMKIVAVTAKLLARLYLNGEIQVTHPSAPDACVASFGNA